jgi:hypothetical protein
MRQPAPGTDVFMRSAFESQIGKDLPVHLGGDTLSGRLLAAEVVEGGSAALLTFDVPGLYLGVDHQ